MRGWLSVDEMPPARRAQYIAQFEAILTPDPKRMPGSDYSPTGVPATPSRCSGTRVQQDSSCYLLRTLSAHVYLIIWQNLGPLDQRRLAQTCAAFKNLPHVFARESVGYFEDLTQETSLENLLICARDISSKWVCPFCLRLHDVSSCDVPGNELSLEGIDCPRTWRQIATNKGHGDYWPEHRHVQLTLKLHRRQDDAVTDEKDLKYLHRLLTPFEKNLPPERYYEDEIHSVKVSVKAKVVGGRYLVGIVQHIKGPEANTWDNLHEHVRRRYCHHLVAYQAVIDNAIANEGREHEGHCTICLSDFSAMVAGDVTVVKFWHDIGDEKKRLARPSWLAFNGVQGRFGCTVMDEGERYRGHVVRRMFEEDTEYLEHSLGGTWMQNTRDMTVSRAFEEWKLGRNVFTYVG